MAADLGEPAALMAVARSGGFREAARASNASASSMSEAASRLAAKLGVRLRNRTTRSVALTEAGARLIDRIGPALGEVKATLDVINHRRDRPAGTLRLNVPASAARLVLPRIVPRFLAAYSGIRLEVSAEESFVDLLAAGCDAGIRYDERLEQDMIAVPIGPRVQRLATAASPSYLRCHRRPEHPRDLVVQPVPARAISQRRNVPWEFERDGEAVKADPAGPLIVSAGGASDLAVDAAIAGSGIVALFEDWLRPYLDSGALGPVLETWWPHFSGPFLYYPGRRCLPAPLRAFVDFIGSRQS